MILTTLGERSIGFTGRGISISESSLGPGKSSHGSTGVGVLVAVGTGVEVGVIVILEVGLGIFVRVGDGTVERMDSKVGRLLARETPIGKPQALSRLDRRHIMIKRHIGFIAFLRG